MHRGDETRVERRVRGGKRPYERAERAWARKKIHSLGSFIPGRASRCFFPYHLPFCALHRHCDHCFTVFAEQCVSPRPQARRIFSRRKSEAFLKRLIGMFDRLKCEVIDIDGETVEILVKRPSRARKKLPRGSRRQDRYPRRDI